MNITWCPVRLISDDSELLDVVPNLCRDLQIVDFQSFAKLEQVQIQKTAFAQILLFDLNKCRVDTEYDDEMSVALKRNPRDIVLGIGVGFPGSIIARLARRGMFGLIDRPIKNTPFSKAMFEANDQCVKLRMEQSELRMLSLQRDSFTKGEEAVLELVVQGVPNKCIATKLEVSQRTIESRRQKIYQKMNAKRLTDLIRTLDKLEFLSRTLGQFA
jgi:FixJ family two-component response regulator